MIPFSNRFIGFVLRMGLIAMISSCSDLAVFVPKTKNASISEFSGIGLTEEGRLSLAWLTKQTSSNLSYDIYLIEVPADDEVYQFSEKALVATPLMYELLDVQPEKMPHEIGTLLDKTTSLNFVMQDLLVPGRNYAIEVVDSKARLKGNSKIILLRVDFPGSESGTAEANADSSKLVWNAVAGANRYEVFADAELTQKIGESMTNELLVKHTGAVPLKDYYIKAYRGLLAAQGVTKISLSSSLAKVLRVKAAPTTGKYRIGDVLTFDVTFSQKVISYGTAKLPLITETKTVTADYASGSGSDTLTFQYTVAAGDDSENLKSGQVLEGEYVDELGLTIAANLPVDTSPDSLKRSSLVMIDTIAPTAPGSVGFQSAYSNNGNANLSWTASTDLHFLEHRLTLCTDTQCSQNCSTEQASTGATKALSGLAEGTYYACVKGLDTFGNVSALSSSLNPLRVDSTPPHVARVFAQSPDGTYILGSTLSLAVEFDETVTVTGDLRLSLNPGGANHDAIYSSGSGTNTLVFTYTVQSDDQTSDLNYAATTSLAFNGGGTLQDLAGNAAVMTLPATGDSHSLAGQSALVLDGSAPSVARVYSVTTNGSYTAPTSITLAVEMSEAVQLTNPNNLRLALATGSTTRYANYASGNGTSTLQFTYTVSSGDVSADLDYVDTSSLSFNGAGTLKDLAGNPGVLTLPASASANSLAGQSALVIDALSPTVARVYSTTTDGIYGTASDIMISVEMSEDVSLTDPNNLRLQLETGTTDRYAVYDSVTGTKIINFRYTVVIGDVTGDLNYLSTSSLAFNGSGTMVDALNNAANLTLPALASAQSLANQSSLSIDTSDFKINKVYAITADGIYNAGDVIEIAVEFNKVVTVTDSTNLKLTLGTGMIQRKADYDSGTGSDTLHFLYTVQAGDTSSDLNYHSNTSLAYESGSTGAVTDPGSQVATLFLPSLASADSLASRSDIVIDTLAPAVAKVYAVTADGAYKAGAVIQLAVEFTEDVTLTGTGGFTLTLANGATPHDAVYTAPIDSKTLGFEYTVQAGDTAADLDYGSINALAKNAAQFIKDAADNDATLVLQTPASTYSLAGQSAIILDTTAPTVERVYGQTTNGTYKVGTTLALKVEFSEPVTLAAPSTMTLGLQLGTVQNAAYASGSGTDTLEFSYAIQAGDNSLDLNYDSTSSLALTGGSTLRDAAGNTATLTLPGPATSDSLAGQSALVVDTTAPTVDHVFAVTTNGSYTQPTQLDIKVEFTENVTVTDSNNLRLALDLNATQRYAAYLSGSGSAQLVFRYAIQTGDQSSDLNYSSTSSLAFNGSGSITDSVGNAAVLTLPLTSDGNSLGGQSNIVVDAVAPNAPVISSPADNATVTAPITSMSGTAEANATIEIFKNSVSLGTTTANGSGNWTYTVSPSLLNGTYTLGATAKDALNNTSAATNHSVTVAIPMPTANAGADVVTKTSQTLVGSTTNAVSRQWTQVSGPGTITFGSATSDSTTVSASAQGLYVLRLSATNANNDTVYDEVNFTWDTAAPTFRGFQNVTQHSSTSARLMWIAAYDNLTADTDITYELCYSSTPGSCSSSFVVAQTFNANTTDVVITGLTADTNYQFLLRAVDKAGNMTNSGTVNNLGLRNVTQIAGGGFTHCVLLSNQTVKCWGLNTYYQLGQGGTDTTERQNPVTVTGLSGVKKVGVGIDHACAIMSDDSVKCWGRNTYGDLGDGTTTDRSSPVAVQGVSNVQDIMLGDGWTCALIKVSGIIQCWGANYFGQLGDGTTTNTSTAVTVSGISSATAIAAGNVFACASFADKTMKCWGRGNSGEMGNNTTSSSTTPVAVSITDVEQFDLAETTVCAVVTGGAVKCWGQGVEGRLGTGNTSNLSVPTQIIASGVSKVAGGWPMNCALMTDQTVKCWGKGGWGAMANDTLVDESTPRVIPNISGVTQLALSNDTVCALLTNTSVKCWGRDDYGQAGDGVVWNRTSPTTVLGISGTPVKVETGIDHSCVLLSNKTVQCWGSNEWGLLGDTSSGMSSSFNSYNTPRTVAGLSNVEVLKVGAYHSCAILSDTTVKCWGRNGSGQLGNNSTTNTSTIQTVVSTSGSGSLSGIVDIWLGRDTTCAVNGSGTMYCWGASKNGLLGDGRTSVTSSIPVAATSFSSAIRTGAIGNEHMCVILDDTAKTVQCVGLNNRYQLADGTTNTRTTPYTTTTDAVTISSRQEHTCILTTTGSMKCWGDNTVGEMGVGNNTASGTVRTVPLANVTQINAGNYYTCAVVSSGRNYCWGENDDDRLGDPSITSNVNQLSPRLTTGLSGAVAVSAGHAQTCALMNDSSVKCWGYNNRSQTGVNRRDDGILLPDQEVSSNTFGD